MPKYRIPITRDVTETALVEIEAESFEDAVEGALNRWDCATFELDDDCRSNSKPYFADDFQSPESEFLI